MPRRKPGEPHKAQRWRGTCLRAFEVTLPSVSSPGFIHTRFSAIIRSSTCLLESMESESLFGLSQVELD